jgi:hypothetical protein
MKKIFTLLTVATACAFTSCRKASETSTLTQPIQANGQTPLNPCGAVEDKARTAMALRGGRVASGPVVLYLDFDGERIQNTVWNTNGSFTCAAVPSSLLSAEAKNYILANVAEDFSAFTVTVTKDLQEYQRAPIDRRVRCVITHNKADQFGDVGGIAYISSLSWADNTPCFVFCDALLYQQKYIAGGISHELGHTLGLQHQSRYDDDCSLMEEFHSGNGSGNLSWAPIMGLSYYQSVVTWHNGPSIQGCDQIQDDISTLRTIAGRKADDYPSTFNAATAATPSTGTKKGILEDVADKDAFRKTENQARRINLQSDGNSDLALEVYSDTGRLENVYDDPSTTDVEVVLTGKKYLRVRNSDQQPFVPATNSLGGYKITVTKL